MIQKGAWYGVWWVWVFWVCGKPPIVNAQIWTIWSTNSGDFLPSWGIALLHSDTRGLSCFLGGSKNRKDTKPISRHEKLEQELCMQYSAILHCFNKLVWSKNHWKAMPNILSIIIYSLKYVVCVCVCADYVFVFQGPFFGEFHRNPQSPQSPARRVRGRVPSQDIGERRQMV